MQQGKEEFCKGLGGSFADRLGGAAMDAAGRRLSPKLLQKYKDNLVKIITKEANRPFVEYRIVASTAFYELHKNYTSMCMAGMGGLLIVYDKQGTGKTRALQAVAREQSSLQPHRFLVLNRTGGDPCQRLYEGIKTRVLGDVQDYDISPEELAEVIAYGLRGEPGRNQSLPATINACRIAVNSKHVQIAKARNFPIVVFDEFVPTDFEWPKDKDLSLGELQDVLGDAFQFFNHLTGLAYNEKDGFVVFVGTKSEAFARALHKINGGSKAKLAPATTSNKNNRDADGNYLFSDWEGLRWTTEDKVTVVRGLFEGKLKKALRGQGLEGHDVDLKAMNIINDICGHDDWNIRLICEDKIIEALRKEEEEKGVVLQSRAQPLSAGATCFEASLDMLKFWK